MRTHEEVLAELCRTSKVNYVTTKDSYKKGTLEHKIQTMYVDMGDIDIISYKGKSYLIHKWCHKPYMLYSPLNETTSISDLMVTMWNITNTLNKRIEYWN